MNALNPSEGIPERNDVKISVSRQGGLSEADQSDISKLYSYYRKVSGSAFPLIMREGDVIVIARGKKARGREGIIGMQTVSEDPRKPGVGYMNNLVVLPIAQGRGVARKLLDAGLAEVRRRGYTAVEAITDERSSPKSSTLLEEAGFKVIETVNQSNDRWYRVHRLELSSDH